MAGLLDLIAERQKTLSAARPNSIAGLLAESGVRPGENLASMAQQYISTLPQKTQANLAYQMSLLDKAYPGDTYQSMMTQGDPKALAELAMQAPYNAMIAYHGTPHNILGKFDISKVGTGEGAQAYGHGMYFAENPAVATEYKTVGGKGEFVKFGDKVVPTASKEGQLLSDVTKLGRKAAINKYPEQADFIKTIDPDNIKFEGGNLYKVDIPDEYIPNMLDWDKPISQQSAKVQEIAKQLDPNLLADTPHLVTRGQAKHWTEVVDSLEDLKNPHVMKLLKKIYGEGAQIMPYGDYLASTMTGEQLYRNLSNPTQWAKEAAPYAMKAGMEDAAVSAKLNELGIPGIRYKDAMSRGVDEGTSNFVIFDPSEIKILEKNSKKVEGLLSE